MSAVQVLWQWTIQQATNAPAQTSDLPSKILTFAAGFHAENLAPEISMLLPTTHGAQQISRALKEQPHLFKTSAAGLLLSDPTLRIDHFVKNIKAAGADWIINLPTLGMHEAQFISHLNEVGIGPAKEFEKLAECKAQGMKIIAALANVSDAKRVATLNPNAVLMLPKVTDFLNGWPSLATRQQSESLLQTALKKHQWSGPCLGYRAHDEAYEIACVQRPLIS